MFNSRLTPIVDSQTLLLFTCLISAGNSTGVVNLVLRSRIGQFLLVADVCSISVQLSGNKKISYITSGRVYKSDEIAEEKKVFERNMDI